MNAEEAWDQYKARRADELRKSASVAGQLDTLAAQMQEMRTDVERLTDLLPQFMGDEGAITTANAGATPDVGGGMDMPGMDLDMGAEGLGGMPSEEEDVDMSTEEETVDKAEDTPEEPNTLPSGGEDAPDEGPSVGDELGVSEDVPEEGVSEDVPPIEGDVSIEADIPAEGPAIDEPAEELPPAGSDIPAIYSQILQLLVQAAGQAVGSGNAEALDGITKSANRIQEAYRDMCPYLDAVMGTDHFTKSLAGTEAPDDMVEKSADAGVTAEASLDVAKSCDGNPDMEKSADTKMHDVEDEKGKEPESQDGPKLGPTDIAKSERPTGLRSIRDMMEKGCGDAKVQDELEKESLGETLDEHIDSGKKLHEAGIDDEGLEAKKKPDMEKSASPNMPDVPETGEDKSVSGTASEGAPDVPEPSSEQSITGSASTGVKPVIDPSSESSLEKCGTPTQSEESDGALSKGHDVPGRQIMSFKDMMAKSEGWGNRPDAVTTANGDVTTPEFGSPVLAKSAGEERVRMGPGVDPHEVTKKDWERYNLFKARGRY